MKAVFVDPDSTRVGFARNILESAGIASFIQNENTRTLGPNLFGFSQTPLNDPRLCVVDEGRADEAVAILREHFAATVNSRDWLCTACKESNPASFEVCWKCQAVKNE